MPRATSEVTGQLVRRANERIIRPTSGGWRHFCKYQLEAPHIATLRGQSRPNTEALRRLEGTCTSASRAEQYRTAKRENYNKREVDAPSIEATPRSMA